MDPSPTAFIPKPLRIIVIGAGLKCDVFILATGRLNNWKLPDIEGLNKFQGSVIHTADWQSGLDYRGKDIAVIGNGASSTQCLAKLSKDAKSIGNFIRGPTYLVPHVFSYNGEPQVNYSKDTIEEFENNPSSYLRFRQQLEQKLAHSFKGLWAESKAAEEFTQTAKQHMIKKIEDPHALEALLPTDYKAGCRRFTPADMYMEALNQSNVELISTPIKLMEGDAIITSDGKRRTYDIIVCGTGFEPYTPRFPIKGRGAADLSELWSMDGGYESYLAATVAGFPNFFDKLSNGKVIVPWPGTMLHYYTATKIVRWEDYDMEFEDKKQKFASFGNATSRRLLTTDHLHLDNRRSGGCKVFSELTDATSGLAYLRTFSRCSLTDKPELMELFDQWLTYATEKIENESEKHKLIKAQLVAAKDEIKSQGVIISGLFRERHSVQITPDDSALVLTLRETIEDLKKKEARMSHPIEKLSTKLADRKPQTYTIFPNSLKSTSSLDQRSSRHTASTNSLSPSDRLSYQSIPSSSTSIRSESRRSQNYRSESEPKRISREAAKECLPQDESHVTQVLRKQLQAERELILALEEAVTDLEANVKELLSECDHWKQQSTQLQTKVDEYKRMYTASC
ncbi:uncharacterized protein FFB14_10547 [Fusarium fujikuroi]|nr:uncharacterized protein FFB14_10547 [Fusarium fujikuroi]